MKRILMQCLAAGVAAAVLAGCTTRVEQVPQEASSETGAAEQAPEPGGGTTILEDEPNQPLPMVPVDAYEVRDLARYDRLAVIQPDKEVSVNAENFYITGVADPRLELVMDGQPVEHRGALGSFGVYVELEMGYNEFVFSQGGSSETVVIRRTSDETVATTSTMTRMRPENDGATRTGAQYTLSCTAPSGATVSAQVGAVTVELRQAAVTQFDGVPAVFSGTYTPPDVDGTVNMGPVVYTMFYDGETKEFPSSGSLFVAGAGEDLVVRATDVCAAVFLEEDDEAGFYSTLPQDAVDVVTEIGGSMYKLDMGGWVLKDAVVPLTEPTSYRSQLSGAKHEIRGSEEAVILSGTANSPYYAVWDQEEGYSLTFFHADGLDSVEVAESRLLSGIRVSRENGNTTLTFLPAGERLWGYLVEYDEGDVVITLSRRRKLAEGDKPLAGITVMVDPGHGGNDEGARAFAGSLGPSEKEINLETAFAVRQKLQSLGAEVLMIREEDERVELSDRARIMRQSHIDFAVSLHCNSISAASDGTRPRGTETYYYDATFQDFTRSIQDAVLSRTGRNDRDIKHDYFKVTINSYAPAVMVEMGFLTNPAEYDDLCSADGIQAMADAVTDGIIGYLRAQ